jgi:hypothetical protein
MINGSEGRVAKLASLKPWELLIVLLALATAIALSVWTAVWVMWIIRPLLAGAAALTAVAWTLRARRRQRSNEEWTANEWIGS